VFVALVKKYYHIGIWVDNGFWTLLSKMIRGEAKFLAFCNLIDGNQWSFHLRP